MIDHARRGIIATGISFGTYVCWSQTPSTNNHNGSFSDPDAAASWMEALINAPPAVSGGFHIGKFLDRMYYLLDEIGWQPSDAQKNLEPVSVPRGFVCDLASIPRIFWSILPPDGSYAFAAVIHDYLYWVQETSKDDADLVLRYAMEDLKGVPKLQVEAIYTAVKYGGVDAWNENSRRRKAGEKRILKRYPDRPDITWSEWSSRAGSV